MQILQCQVGHQAAKKELIMIFTILNIEGLSFKFTVYTTLMIQEMLLNPKKLLAMLENLLFAHFIRTKSKFN